MSDNNNPGSASRPERVKSRGSRFGMSYLTPLYGIRRAADSLAKTGQTLGAAARAAAQSLPGQKTSAQQAYEEGDPRRLADPHERFEAIYEINNWTPDDLRRQLGACRNAKLVALLMSVLAFFGVVVAAVYASLLLRLLLIPCGGCVLLLGIAQCFRYALYETQISLRALISARDFVSRPDFWIRLLG